MDAKAIETLRAELNEKYQIYLKAESALKNAKKEWLDAESKWQEALVEYADELRVKRTIHSQQKKW
jgi:hypothetical protein